MSSLAMLVKDKGYEVKGSDVEEYIFTQEELERKGIPVLNFNKNNFNKDDIVIIGHKFIDSENEEVVKAKTENKWYEYNDFIGGFIKEYFSIAVSGSHGKTTTTSLIANAISEIDDCGYLIGDGTSHISQSSNYFVFEACEQKEHFLKYRSNIVLINNVDYDHVDYFKKEGDYIQAFYKFSKNAKDKIIVNGDDINLSKIENSFKYGLDDNNNLIARNINENEEGISYDLYHNGSLIKRVAFPFYGHHMIYNTLATIAVCLNIGMDMETTEKGINKFKGVKRRFNEQTIGDCVYIDDYAHHPSEISATIKACKQKYPNREIIAFFRGDRYSRVYKFASEIANSLSKANQSYVLPFPKCSSKEKGIDIDESYITLFSSKVKLLNEFEYRKLAKLENCVYLFMSSKNMKDVENKIMELKKEKM